MNDAVQSIVTVAVAIIGVAALAVLVSRNANTAGVLTSAGGALSTALSAAVSPVTGGSGFGAMSFTGGGAGYIG